MITVLQRDGQPTTLHRVVSVCVKNGLPIATVELVEDKDWQALTEFAMERAARARKLALECKQLHLAASELITAFDSGVPDDFDARMKALRHVVRDTHG